MIVAEQSINKLKEDAHQANGEVVAHKATPHQSVLNYIGQHRYYVLGACLGRRLSAVVHGEWSVTFYDTDHRGYWAIGQAVCGRP